MIILLAIALLIDGIARVIHGIADKTSRSWSRIFRIAAGVIAIVLALVIIASPVIGAGSCRHITRNSSVNNNRH